MISAFDEDVRHRLAEPWPVSNRKEVALAFCPGNFDERGFIETIGLTENRACDIDIVVECERSACLLRCIREFGKSLAESRPRQTVDLLHKPPQHLVEELDLVF
jgi:hypothetical protein